MYISYNFLLLYLFILFFNSIICDEIIPAEVIQEKNGDFSTTVSPTEIVTSGNKILLSSIQSPINKNENNTEELKKSIHNKMRRLRKLKKEIRKIKQQLEKERRLKIIKNLPSEEQIIKIDKWKNRMKNKIKTLNKKVNKMEKQMKHRRQKFDKKYLKNSTLFLNSEDFYTTKPLIINKKQRKNQHKIKKNKKITTTQFPVTTVAETVTTTTISPTTIVQNPLTIMKNITKVKRSHKGLNGDSCKTHGDCASGHCCHRFGLSGKAICIQHDLNLGAHCKHSCACIGGMKCVRIQSPLYPQLIGQCRALTKQQLEQAHLKNMKKKHLTSIHL